MNAVLLVVVPLLLAAPTSKSKPAKSAAKKELVRRVVEITDATSEVPVSITGGGVTTLFFSQPVGQVLLPDPDHRFEDDASAQGKALLLRPTADLPPGTAMAMQVSLADGTVLPPFILTSSEKSTDLFVDVSVKLQKRASADSAVGLRAQLSELQGRLDECQQSAGEKGAVKVGELVLKQDFRKPVAFIVEKHPARKLDKQAFLLVETLAVYRLFDASYLVLTVENRDPDKVWVLDRAEVSIAGGSSNVDARVLDVAQEMSQGIPPGVEAKLVVVYKTPEQSADQRFTLKLFEKAGNRHISLENLKL